MPNVAFDLEDSSQYSKCSTALDEIRRCPLENTRVPSQEIGKTEQLLTEPMIKGLSAERVFENTEPTPPTSAGSPA